MESYGPTYVAYTKLWTQHLLNRFTVGRLHAEFAAPQLAARSRPIAERASPRPLAPDAWRGASLGARCNPLRKADFVSGTGCGNAMRQPALPWRSMLSWNAAGHAARMQYVLDDARVANSDYTERGLMGEVVEGLYITTAMSFFVPGYGVGWVGGFVCSAVLAAAGWVSGKLLGTAWRGPPCARGAEVCGNAVGALLGSGAGCLASAGPYAAVLAARLPALPLKALCAGAGLLAASTINRSTWMRYHARAAWAPVPAPG